jgi:hypothetical protein
MKELGLPGFELREPAATQQGRRPKRSLPHSHASLLLAALRYPTSLASIQSDEPRNVKVYRRSYAASVLHRDRCG